MRKKFLPITLSAVMVAGVMGVAGCSGGGGTETTTASGSDTTAATTTASGGSGKSSGEVTAFVGTSIFGETLDPIKGFMSYGYPFINNALIKVDSNSNYVGDLADSWEISDDALTYTYKLKKDVKFSDGSDFTAEDVVFTYETVKANQANNENVDLTTLKSVKAVDDYTVEFTLSEAYSPFFDTTAQLQIVPSDSYDSTTFDTKPIGTGAFTVAEFTTNQQIILEANKDCFNGAPGVDKITLVYMDQDAAIAAANSGQLDIVMVSPNYAKENVSGMTLHNLKTMDVRQVSLPVIPEGEEKNSDGETQKVGNNITSDLAVRKALSIGINRQNIIDNGLNGVGTPATSFVNLAWSLNDDSKDGQVDEAKKVLEEGGWKDSDGDGIVEKDGKACEFEIIAPGNDMDRYNLAMALAEEAKGLGIKINVKNLSWDEAYALTTTTPIVWGWGQYNPVVIKQEFLSDVFLTGRYNDVVGYKNAAVDSAIKAAISSSTNEEANKNWKEAQAQAKEDYPYLYLVNIEHSYFVNENLDISDSTQIKHPHGHGSPIVCNIQDWSWK